MTKTKWWLRIVGGFYLLLTLMNLWFLFLGDPQIFTETLPAPLNADPLAVRAFTDAWLVFVFELGVLGGMMVYASRDPLRNRVMVWTIIWAEVFRGVVADLIWIMRGYAAASYIPFIIVHIIIIATGLIFLRQESAKAGAPLKA